MTGGQNRAGSTRANLNVLGGEGSGAARPLRRSLPRPLIWGKNRTRHRLFKSATQTPTVSLGFRGRNSLKRLTTPSCRTCLPIVCHTNIRQMNAIPPPRATPTVYPTPSPTLTLTYYRSARMDAASALRGNGHWNKDRHTDANFDGWTKGRKDQLQKTRPKTTANGRARGCCTSSRGSNACRRAKERS